MLTITIVLVILFILWKFTPNSANKKATGMMFQMLESFHLIDSTVKFDVFTRRLDLLAKLANTLPKNADQKKCIELALQAYRHKYPTVPTSPTIRRILDQPEIATSSKFRDEAYTAFYMRLCAKLKDEINTLKTAAAKQRRIKQANDIAEIILERLASSDRLQYAEYINNEFISLSKQLP